MGYLAADIICSEKQNVFWECSPRKTVNFEEQIMSKDKYVSMFSRPHEAIVLIILWIFFATCTVWWSFICSFVFFTFYGYIVNTQCDQLPDGLISQLLEHCTSVSEVISSNHIWAWIFQAFVCITVMINYSMSSYLSLQFK